MSQKRNSKHMFKIPLNKSAQTHNKENNKKADIRFRYFLHLHMQTIIQERKMSEIPY
jgi:hypothetical protein